MNFINTLGFLAICFLLVRVIILIKIDSHRKKNTFFKFLFGAYAFEAMIPIIRKPDSKEEATLVKAANICLAVFYMLFVTVLLTVWFRYRNPTYKPDPNNNRTEQAMLGINLPSPTSLRRRLSYPEIGLH
jgi:hypothetical protein